MTVLSFCFISEFIALISTLTIIKTKDIKSSCSGLKYQNVGFNFKI